MRARGAAVKQWFRAEQRSVFRQIGGAMIDGGMRYAFPPYEVGLEIGE
jgi:hypothetical protein